MKRIIVKICLAFLSFFVIANNIYAATPTTLKELKEELQKDIANKNVLINKQKEIQTKIDSLEKELSIISKEIEECEKGIEEAKLKIEELNEEIVKKNKEIDSLMSFKQITDGDNVYLEYIFGASSFTDFIYRSALVEQLSEYNDQLIEEMNSLIKENEELQVELQEKIKESEAKTLKLEKKLASYDLDMDDISEDQKDIEADIKARQAEVKYYEEQYKLKGCSEDTEIYTCIGVPYSNGFIRPIKKGSVTSEFGMRYHPTLHYYRMHNGIDLGLSMGNDVYSAAAGVVVKLTIKSSCGGNMVWIQHNIDGEKYRTVYQHLATIKVKIGDVVTNNTVIGTSGGGGYTLKKNGGWDTCSTGAHLHFGILKGWTGSSYVNPRNYISFPSKGKRFSSRY